MVTQNTGSYGVIPMFQLDFDTVRPCICTGLYGELAPSFDFLDLLSLVIMMCTVSNRYTYIQNSIYIQNSKLAFKIIIIYNYKEALNQ